MVKHRFFTETVKVVGKRYKFHDIGTKFLLFEHANRVTDTKKAYLDNFVKTYKLRPKTDAAKIKKSVVAVMDAMASKFSKHDTLLASVGMLSVYYLLFRKAISEEWISDIRRNVFLEFEEALRHNRELASNQSDDTNFDLLEFSRLSQSPNDASAIRFRLAILNDFVRDRMIDKKRPLLSWRQRTPLPPNG